MIDDAKCYVDNGFDNVTNVIYNIASGLNHRKFGDWLDLNKSFGSLESIKRMCLI